MDDDKDFRVGMQKIGELVRKLDTIADPAARAGAKELVQLLMDLHGKGLERILDIVFQSRTPGQPIIDELGQDALVSSLLILYGLHPEDLQTRVEQKLRRYQFEDPQDGGSSHLGGRRRGEYPRADSRGESFVWIYESNGSDDRGGSYLRSCA